MLAGEPPFIGPNAQAIVAKVITEKPAPVARVRDSVPAYVDAAIAQALVQVAGRPAVDCGRVRCIAARRWRHHPCRAPGSAPSPVAQHRPYGYRRDPRRRRDRGCHAHVTHAGAGSPSRDDRVPRRPTLGAGSVLVERRRPSDDVRRARRAHWPRHAEELRARPLAGEHARHGPDSLARRPVRCLQAPRLPEISSSGPSRAGRSGRSCAIPPPPSTHGGRKADGFTLKMRGIDCPGAFRWRRARDDHRARYRRGRDLDRKPGPAS